MKRSDIYEHIRKSLKQQNICTSETSFASAEKAIDSERDYQAYRWGQSAPDGKPGSGERTAREYALYINGYTEEALQVASHVADPQKKLEPIRKIAGLCAAALEQRAWLQTLDRTDCSDWRHLDSIDEFIFEIVKIARGMFALQTLDFEKAVTVLLSVCIQCMAKNGAPLRTW